MSFLAGLASLYSLLIFIRIILTWFNRSYGKPVELLTRVTDPYLDWWRRVSGLRIGFLDLSPIVAMAALSVLQTVFSTIARYGKISLGIILAICLSALWSAASFLLGFCLIILVLRFIAYLSSRDTTGSFWRIIDTISRPVLYRIQRIIFSGRLVNYMTGMLVSIAALALVWIGGRFAVNLLIKLLFRLPV
jgi:YggT family protein